MSAPGAGTGARPGQVSADDPEGMARLNGAILSAECAARDALEMTERALSIVPRTAMDPIARRLDAAAATLTAAALSLQVSGNATDPVRRHNARTAGQSDAMTAWLDGAPAPGDTRTA